MLWMDTLGGQLVLKLLAEERRALPWAHGWSGGKHRVQSTSVFSCLGGRDGVDLINLYCLPSRHHPLYWYLADLKVVVLSENLLF